MIAVFIFRPMRNFFSQICFKVVSIENIIAHNWKTTDLKIEIIYLKLALYFSSTLNNLKIGRQTRKQMLDPAAITEINLKYKTLI